MRKLSLLLLACLTLGIAWAERVSVNTAQQVAANVAAGLSPSNLRSNSDLKLVYAAPAKQQSGLRSADNESDYYIFNVGTGDGFIIVAGEDRVRPVLGYSAEGEVDMEKMPGNMKAWLEMYQKEISWAVSQGISASGDVEKEWQEVLNGTTNLRAVDPPLQTAHWAQGEPYNWMTPDVNGIQTVTGCVATAQAIVMKYYEYPEQAIVASTNSTYKINGAEHTTVVNYDAYDWDNMLDEYEEGMYNEQQGNAVAKLMWHCGANVGMNYGTGGSGASAVSLVNSFKNIFGYSQSVQYVDKIAYRWADWIAMFKEELDNRRPIIVCGNDGYGGHAFVCDGYNSKDHFHINWGWGFSFGYFLLTSLDDDYDGRGYADSEYGAVIGIQPEGGEPAVAAPFINYFYYAGRPGAELPESPMVLVGYYYSCTEAISCWNGLAVLDEDDQIIQKPTYYTTHDWNEIGGYYTRQTNYSIKLEEPLSEGQRIAMVYSTNEGATWHVTRVGAEVPLGLNNEGMIKQDSDDPEEQEVPVNVRLQWNQFDDIELEVITDGSTYSFDNTQALCLNIGGLKTDAWMGISVNDPALWISHLRIYYGSSYDIYKENAGTLATGENGKWWIPVSLNDIDKNYYMPYLKILPDKAGIINYDIQLYSEDKKTLLAEVKGQQMKTEGAEEPVEPAITVQMISNPFRFRYLAVNDEYSGRRVGKMEPVQYKLTGAEGNVWVCYTLKNPAWAEKIDLCCDIEEPVYTYSSSEELQFDSEGKAWVEVPADKIEDGLVTNYLYLKVAEKVAENFDYSISLYNADKTVCYQTFDYTMPVVNQPMILEFSPDELYGDTDEEFIFSVTAKNVDPKMANQQTSISLEIEGSVDGEVDVDLITSEGRKELNVIPYYVDANVCMTEAEIVENLAEGQVYQFALRFLDGKKPGGIIRVEEIYINGNMNVVYEGSELSIDYSPVIVVDDKISYEGSSHYGARVTVTSTGVYEINTPNASIRSLNIQPGGQIKLDTELKVGQLSISHRIPTNAWTTFGVPESSQNIILGDGNSGLLERGVIASRMGYRDVNDQEWIESNEADLPPGTAILLAQNAETEQMFGFHNRLFYEEFAEPLVLPTRIGSTAPDNDDNGNWFHFVANPLWENLMINGRAYVLNEATNSFELQQSPVIPPFQAYMIASEAVMNSISSLRIGDIPTSNEDLAVTGFRVWSESGHVCFETTEAKDVAVYSMNGVQQCRFERSVGMHRQQLPQGIYIVVCDGTAYKVSVK